jgi:UDP-N-acetylmuramyl-tripeptide synthetase
LSLQLYTSDQAANWLRERVTGSLWTDSRKLGQGDGFVAWPGAATDGRKYVADALAAGVAACLVEQEGAAAYAFKDDRVATYAGLKAATGPIAAAYFNSPSRQLQVVAVTGTNGKTSTAWWLAQALARLGHKCGVVGTLGIGEPGAMVFNGLTTPDPVLLQQQLRRFVDEGFSACALEASSVGIVERRLDATAVQVAIFTNFTQDHLDYHASMQSYWEAKQKLFGWPGLKAAVINVDDSKGVELSTSLGGSALDIWTLSCERPARLQACAIHHGAQTLSFDVVEGVGEGAERHRISTHLVGQYNVSNLLGVMAALRALGLPLTDAVSACADLSPVPGRMEIIAVAGLPLVVIDYAHTPDALEKVLMALKPAALSRGGQLWCVFGCGGDRDATKRPLMAAVAENNADQVVLTSDNPRSENPLAIIGQVLLGLSHRDAVHVQADRAVAIADALRLAQPCDVVLLAGKGHESYQEVDGHKLTFSDRAHAQAALDALDALAAGHLPAGGAA